MKNKYPYFAVLWALHLVQSVVCFNITSAVFGSDTKIMPAAFGDFNSDELSDLFVISDEEHMVEILVANSKEPYFLRTENLNCTVSTDYFIKSVVPGDFDGDDLTDVLITVVIKKNNVLLNKTFVFINYGFRNNSSGSYYLNCSDKPVIEMTDEPLAIFTDTTNMTVSLFGTNANGDAVFWKFKKNRTELPEEVHLNMSGAPPNFKMRIPHSHAFLDLNNDNAPDLYLTGESGYGIWLYNYKEKRFAFNKTVNYPENLPYDKIGQTLFIDLETSDNMYPIVPVCKDDGCSESAIYVYADDMWFNLNISFVDSNNTTWGFVQDGHSYTDTKTLRAGDFNNDGYVDLLATLKCVRRQEVNTFLLENVPCSNRYCGVKRTFEIKWNAFPSSSRNAVMGTFYDFMQDGILDIIFVHSIGTSGKEYRVSAFKNSLDYDANFMKVMVITGLKDKENELLPTSFLSQKRLFGMTLPGAKIRYKTTTQDSDTQIGVAAQLPQSAHFALYLPYTIFGLGRTPNFVEDLTVGLFNESRTWNQIVPNSQLVVIPIPPDEPYKWRVQMFVNPSKMIVLHTVYALAGTCVVIAFIIALLHWKERREDRIERLQEAHRFHFDAM